MNVLFLTSELAGYMKAGGLADVSAALPSALRKRGLDVRVLLPFYGTGPEWTPSLRVVAQLPGLGELPPCELAEAAAPDGCTAWFVISPELYQRPGTPYNAPTREDWPDNDVRFGRLALAAAQVTGGAAGIDWQPDLLHANDWPSALAAGYCTWRGIGVPCLFTIHNLAYQGLFDPLRLDALGIPASAFAMHGVEFHGRLSFMKAGLFYAAHVTTVSPNYAREITTEQFGSGLEGLLADLSASGKLTGILNGVGDDWNPEVDQQLVQNFPPRIKEGKQQNAGWLRDKVGLQKSNRPLFVMVSRFVHQKGVDLALTAVQTIAAAGGHFFLLGEGDPELERLATETVADFAGSAAVMIAFDEAVSRRAIAASDFYLMPSRFEPCGLNQMYAERYGSLPIAHATGGLVDSIQDGETGFLFSGPTPEALRDSIVRALNVYIRPGRLTAMRKAAMAHDFSWAPAAARYEDLYRRICRF